MWRRIGLILGLRACLTMPILLQSDYVLSFQSQSDNEGVLICWVSISDSCPLPKIQDFALSASLTGIVPAWAPAVTGAACLGVGPLL